jgi:CubicO group peptidase (beta-lactamase class C family)
MLRIALLALLFIPALAVAQDPIRDRFLKFSHDGELAGAVVLVGTKDKIVYEGATGMANFADRISMEKSTLFRIASMTKPLTAIAIMMLVDDGKLSIGDAVEKHLPVFKGQMLRIPSDAPGGPPVPNGGYQVVKPPRPITLKDLLTHTSGLANYPEGMADVYTKRNYTLSETSNAVSQRPLDFEPGTKWSYCNSGIDTLGRIVEVASGMSFEKFLQARIFDPLGMKDSTFYPTKEQVKNVARTYGIKDGKLVPAPNNLLDVKENPKHPVPAGGLYSTACDQAKLYQFMLNGGKVGEKQLLSEKSIKEMTTTQTGKIKTGFVDGMSWGLGWQVVAEPKGATEALSTGSYGHGGAFGTQGWIDPKKGVFYILMIQRTGLANGDASEFRKEFQRLGSKLVKK